MPVKLLRFGEGPEPEKKANTCEVYPHEKVPEPVKKANACEVYPHEKGPEPVKKANACEARRP